MARCGCGASGGCGCNLVAGDNVSVTGSGSEANPWRVSAVTNCAEVRQCLSANQGAAYNSSTGVISVCVSPNAGNSLTRDANGCLYVSPGNNAVQVGCGLQGNGTAATPLTIRGKAWPFPCTQDSATANGVYCDPNTGQLHSDPPYKQTYFNQSKNQTLAAPITIPAALTTIDTFSFTITNPDPCRPALGLLFREIDLQGDWPPGAVGAGHIDGDEMFAYENTGSTTQNNIHNQENKITELHLAPGETQTITMAIGASRGANGAIIRRIQATLRAFLWSPDVV